MDTQILSVCLIIVYLSCQEVEASAKLYAFDQRKYCPENGAHTQSLMLHDEVILLAKSKSDSSIVDRITDYFFEPVTECEMKFMTSSQDSNKKQALEIEFESFNIARVACDVRLEIHQSSTQFFTADVKEMATLTCGSPKPPIMYTDRAFVVRFRFFTSNSKKDYFNFRITIKRSVGEPKEEGMSIGVKIGVTVISVAAAITLLLLVYKFVKLRCETKDIENPSQRSRQGSDEDEAENLRDYHDDNFVMTDFPYANMPIVILNGDEAPPPYKDIAPPAYEEALQMPKATKQHEEATYSNFETLHSGSNFNSNQGTSQSSLQSNTEPDTVESDPGDIGSSQSNLARNIGQATRQPNIATNVQPATGHSTEQTQV